ncbi:hypothetical protein V6N00_13360 [Tersicoccus sp. MR15.9]|uniref:hypothetical protein n=1 Tax=Tersicoccus mangrovi TaxID=3121635 RepID=UPI002FE675B5
MGTSTETAACTVCGEPTDRAVLIWARLLVEEVEQSVVRLLAVCLAHWAEAVVRVRYELDLAGTVARFSETGPVAMWHARAQATALAVHLQSDPARSAQA